jgi:hypothetical protein
MPTVTFVIVENRWPDRVGRLCDYIRANVREARITVRDDLPTRPDKAGYDEFCVKRLGECFTTEHAMVVQLDGFPVRWDKWDEEFLSYDYVGAPWPEGWLRAGGIESDARVGNGGCSLRSRRLCAALAEAEWEPMADDVFISARCRPRLEGAGMKWADVMTAARFGIEYAVPEHGLLGQPFSFHDTRVHPQHQLF